MASNREWKTSAEGTKLEIAQKLCTQSRFNNCPAARILVGAQRFLESSPCGRTNFSFLRFLSAVKVGCQRRRLDSDADPEKFRRQHPESLNNAGRERQHPARAKY